jgi:hypothetical protein
MVKLSMYGIWGRRLQGELRLDEVMRMDPVMALTSLPDAKSDNTLILYFLASKSVRNKVCCVSHLAFYTLL